jgi:transketolase
LEAKGISAEVINIHTKPLDEEAILKSLAKTKCTAEEHNILEVLESISRLLH